MSHFLMIEDIATDVLVKHVGDVDKATLEFVSAVQAAKLIDDLAREYLRMVVARGGSQTGGETHNSVAGPARPSTDPGEGPAREPGQERVEAQQPDAGLAQPTPANGSIKVRAHDVRPHRRRTHAEREAARRAAAASIEAVFDLQINGRAIGKIAIGELMALKRDLVADAINKLLLSIDQVKNAVLAELVENHCQVPDTLMRVRDAIDARTLSQFVKQAEEEAPRRLADAMRRAAEAIDHTKEIAA